MISFSGFKKLDLKVGKIEKAEHVKEADKLLKLQVDIGSEKRQIVAGLAQTHQPEDLEGVKTIFLTNLEPKEIMNTQSEGMLLAGTKENGSPVLFKPEEDLSAGARVK
ncbi:MAG: methionine--tRNA ligase subunit beta [Candidatus Magasanikbacteria bacterium]